MANGTMGKMLWVDLTTKKIKEETLNDKTARDYLGGYGLGARVLFDRQKPGVDPLGPDNILGFVTGVLTGTQALGGSRYVVVGKSPLTGGWGDANSGGNFGPYLKFAGYDAVFFTGISAKPVYLYIENGKAELRDAAHLWGKDTFETEDILRSQLGKDVELACIGPSGETKSLIAAVMNNKGRAAGRSGLGAVMGAKKLKAVALKGNTPVPVADEKAANDMRRRHLAALGPRAKFMRDLGTAGLFNMACESDDAPCRNWGGTSVIDYPNFKNLGGDKVLEKRERGYGCWHCPIACGGIMKPSSGGEYEFSAESHKPEYETLAMFGSNLLNDNLDSIIKLNDICNRYGLDTISAGACIAFAAECYEHGIITKKDTDGIDLTWGNHKAIVAMTEKLGKRQGLGNILADGVKVAARKIGKGSEKYAMHAGGQEFPAHDSRGGPGFAIAYGGEPTPARHTQGGEGPLPPGSLPDFNRGSYQGRGAPHKMGASICQAYNAAGICMIVLGDGYGHFDLLIEALKVITGWDFTREEMIKTGERIEAIRQAFNVREGIKTPWEYPDRMMGIPPKQAGPRKGITLKKSDLYDEYYQALDWDTKTGKPSQQRLKELGLADVAKALYK
jgi:aldehyde:ferredoxin oxidoreductase